MTLEKEETEVGVPVEELQAKTFTQEDWDAAKAELEERVRQEEFVKYQGLQKVISKKDAEIERLAKQPSNTKTMTTVVDELERLSQSAYESDPASQARISTLKTQLAAEEQRAYQENIIHQNQERINQEIKSAGYDPTDDRFEGVWDMFEVASVDGVFTRVDRKLEKVLNKIPVVKEETNVVDIEKLVEEKAEEKLRVKMEERGLLHTDLGGASGGEQTFTRDQIKDRGFWNANREAILAAQAAGRIK